MLRSAALAGLLLALPLAGCLQGPAIGGSSVETPDLAMLRLPWPSPQTAAHPLFGWPTVNDPAAGLALDALPEWWAPPPGREIPEAASRLARVAGADEPHQGAGIAIFGSLVAVADMEVGARLYDIREPERPRLLATLEGTPGRDADFVAFPDGRLILVLATSYKVLPVWDVTDPTEPALLAEIAPPAGTHNVAVVPGTPYLYNANSAGGGRPSGAAPMLADGQTEIYDLRDPAKPALVAAWKNGYGCHDISFHLDGERDKYRAYCAGIQVTQIWDVADPARPTVLATVPVHHGRSDLPATQASNLALSHMAVVNHDASVLIVGDETGGGRTPPGCDVHAEAAGRSVSGPLGNLYFYDLTDETSPVLKSWVSPSHHWTVNPPYLRPSASPAATVTDTLGTCTAHFGRILEDRDVLVIGFYAAGVALVDFSDLEQPRIVDQWAEKTDTWDVWVYQGYAFTGDTVRGFDVLRIE